MAIGNETVLTHKVTAFDGIHAESEEKQISLDDDTTTILLCVEKYLSYGGDGYAMFKTMSSLGSIDTALFGIVGEYILSVSGGNEFVYPPVVDDVTYDESLGLKTTPTDITFVVAVDNSKYCNKKIKYAFYTASMSGEPKTYETTTDNNGEFIAARPAGASVLGVWADDKYIEVFMHSYFGVNADNIKIKF